MLLTLTTTHQPAADLGYLLRKNPARPQSFDLSFGRAHVFYPEASNERCTVALLVEVDPVGLVRNRRGPSGEGGALEQYVNDRPYAASSFLSVANANIFGSALAGNSKERPELVEVSIPLHVAFSALPCRGGEQTLRKLFEPLGYNVTATRLPLDDRFPDWGESVYFRVELAATLPLKQFLSHLYVLMPVNSIFKMLSMQTYRESKTAHSKRTEGIGNISHLIQWFAVCWLVILFAGCSQPHGDYSKITSAEKLWYKADYEYRTNDLPTAYRLTLDARNQLEKMSKTNPNDLHYSYCLAFLNARLFLMARSLENT